jgi:hypothetical protein
VRPGTPLSVELRPLTSKRVKVGELTLLAAYQLRSSHPRFGGFSGLVVTKGPTLVAISDRCWWLTARMKLDAAGRLVGLEEARIARILGKGGAVQAVKGCDSEGLATARDGAYLVSYEQAHRIWRYGRPGSAAEPVWRPTEKMPSNGGLEALTVLADGRLLAISERLAPAPGVHRAWLVEGARATPLTCAVSEGFVPTGAATLPDGDVLLLERAFSPLYGVSARIRRIAGRTIAPGARLTPRELARLESPLSVDNFEGIAVHGRDVYVISDDNFSGLQRTLLFQLRMR